MHFARKEGENCPMSKDSSSIYSKIALDIAVRIAAGN
jgi:hypothetical protein